ncbi:uncharacterized protein LOC133779897 [Humulus lupulus]|uniref:uncharacterized protein LOC133779897 n=1 Tax=Humulus lupulus TaxID=3486 RepID=UPI002B406099|nr:uncharacterized protein LOC133779897 [Humulus lupulus]
MASTESMDVDQILTRALKEFASEILTLTTGRLCSGAVTEQSKSLEQQHADELKSAEEKYVEQLEAVLKEKNKLAEELKEKQSALDKAVAQRDNFKESNRINYRADKKLEEDLTASRQETKTLKGQIEKLEQDNASNLERNMWNKEDFNSCVKVDVHVFIYDLPPQHDFDIDADVDSEDYMDNMTINFVAVSQQSIERLEKVLIKDDQIVCSICFENVHVGLEATKLPCTHAHTHHEKFIVQWLQTSKFCPIYRFEIV